MLLCCHYLNNLITIFYFASFCFYRKQEKWIKKQDIIIKKQNMKINFLEKQIANHSTAIRDCRSGQTLVNQRNEVSENHDHSRNVKKCKFKC
jgi:amino acid permease